MKRCTQCVLPENFPGARFNDQGVCHFCVSATDVQSVRQNRQRLKVELDEMLKAHIPIKPYDTIVALSGGKDSSYTLKLLSQDYGLSCLAVTIDNGFLSEKAKNNCQAVTDSLGVDFISMKPTRRFMNNMYTKSIDGSFVHSKSSISRASEVCNSCINLINNAMIKVALQNQTPIIAGGYIGGQVPKDAAVIEYDIERQNRFRKKKLDSLTKSFGANANNYFDIPEHLLFGIKKIKIINPMLTLSLSEEEIIQEISKLGWEKSKDTGLHSSNCKLNDLGIYFHHKKFGFHPYVAEIAEQVRCGLMDREKALSKVTAIPESVEIKTQADQLGVALNESNNK